jgi:hypothetical protein
MIAELRGGFFLLLSFALFVLIIGMLALGTVMRPARWRDRPGPAR